MEFFQLIGHAISSILIAYLSFTNTLAVYIENAFLPFTEQTNVAETQSNQATSTTSFDKLVAFSKKFSNTIPFILKEHEAFQRASVLASSLNDDTFSLPSDKALTENIRDVLVNIYCQYKTDEYIRTTTGTGFFINPKGVILTNAHVAQFLLLDGMQNSNGEVSCVIRAGDPASPKYHAELLYISPKWVFENADLITSEAPRGTGERDYALLYVSKSIDQSPLPSHFTAINVSTDFLPRSISGNEMITAGYPAEALIRGGANVKLPAVVASTTLKTLYTFGSNYADIFSISESPVGEQGASGGPVVSPLTQTVIGLIVTKGDESSEGSRSLRALTLSYIDRTIIEETGYSLIQNMQGDVSQRGKIFKTVMVPFLAGILNETLSHNTQN